jgi:hypothetical protein
LPKGVSGNPGGRPKGQAELSKSARTLVGEGGEALIQIWWSIANDPMRRDADRLRASELLADRGWGKAPAFGCRAVRIPQCTPPPDKSLS